MSIQGRFTQPPREALLSIILILGTAILVQYTRGPVTAEANIPRPTLRLANRQALGSYAVMGTASWYSRSSPGIRKRTANNEIFNDQAMTCAMWGTEFNRRVRVTNLKNGRSVILRVNDRGPHRRYAQKGRVIDLTRAAFSQLSDSKKGLIQVKVEVL